MTEANSQTKIIHAYMTPPTPQVAMHNIECSHQFMALQMIYQHTLHVRRWEWSITLTLGSIRAGFTHLWTALLTISSSRECTMLKSQSNHKTSLNDVRMHGGTTLTSRRRRISTGRVVGSECLPGSAAGHTYRMYGVGRTLGTSESREKLS